MTDETAMEKEAQTHLKSCTDEYSYTLKMTITECGALHHLICGLCTLGSHDLPKSLQKPRNRKLTSGVANVLLDSKCSIWKENAFFLFLQGL